MINTDRFSRFFYCLVFSIAFVANGCSREELAREELAREAPPVANLENPNEAASPDSSESNDESLESSNQPEETWKAFSDAKGGFSVLDPGANSVVIKSSTDDGIRFDRWGFPFGNYSRGQILQFTYEGEAGEAMIHAVVNDDTDQIEKQVDVKLRNFFKKIKAKLHRLEVIEDENQYYRAEFDFEEPDRTGTGIAFVDRPNQLTMGFGVWSTEDKSSDPDDGELAARKFKKSLKPLDLDDGKKLVAKDMSSLFDSWKSLETETFSILVPDVEARTVSEKDTSMEIATRLYPLMKGTQDINGIVQIREITFAEKIDFANADLTAESLLKSIAEEYVEGKEGIAATNNGVAGKITSFQWNADNESADFTFDSTLDGLEMISKGQACLAQPNKVILLMGSSITLDPLARIKSNKFVDSFQKRGR